MTSQSPDEAASALPDLGPTDLPPTEVALPHDESTRLHDVTARAAARLGAAACSVALLEDDELVYVAASGTGAAQVRGMRLTAGRGIGGFVAASGQALAVADVRQDPRHDREAATRSGYLPTSILAVPVEDEEGPVGVLTVLDRRIGAHDLEVAAEAAAEVAQVLASREPTAGWGTDPTDVRLADLVRRLATRPATDRREAVRLLQGILEP